MTTDTTPRTVYLNGRFCPADQAHISAFDGGFLHGAGLFETMRAQSGRVFRLEAHLDRIVQSARALLSPIQRDQLPDSDVFETLLTRNNLTNARLRLTLSLGSMFDVGHEDETSATVLISADPLIGYPAENYQRGITVRLARWLQAPEHPLSGHKSTCYLPRLHALRDALRAGCGETLFFAPSHHLAEGAVSNVFIVQGQHLRTPALELGVLPGIARATVLELARNEGIDCDDQAHLTVDDLHDADEVFLTNVIMTVLPVCRIEKHDIANAKPGPITQRLHEALQAQIHHQCR